MPKPPDTLHGHPLTADELDELRKQIEGFDSIEAIDPGIRAIVERNWPELVPKLPPK